MTKMMTASTLLRKSTAASHRAAEARLSAPSILDGTFSATDFAEMMRIHYLVWSATFAWWPQGQFIEPQAADFLEKMVEMLRRDLEISNLPTPAVPTLSLDNTDAATRYGVMYVLRGSTLGGTMINRKLRDCAGLSGLQAFLFHEACEAIPGREWPAFLRELDTAVVSENEQVRAIAGAEAIFGLYLSA